jgi:hypothetical protein
LVLPDASGKIHMFFRRKRNNDGTWTAVEDAPWIVDLTAKLALRLSEEGYSVVAVGGENEQAPKRRKKE